MNLSQALEYANTFFIPEFIFGAGYQVMESERAKGEESIKLLRENWFAEEEPRYPFSIVRELADRNRDLCDEIGPEHLANLAGLNLARGLSDEDICRSIAALQRRKPSTVMREVRGDRGALAVAYVSKPVKGTVIGIDIETTSRDPDRGYIVNVGWEFMELASDAEPYGPEAHYCGLPGRYEQTGVPLEEIHHISWGDVAGKKPFREDRELQAKLLKLLQKYPFMAHNAAFEDSWFTLHLDGYAEARKAGKIVPVDTRDICRKLDAEVASALPSSNPASLENWARRRGTLAPDAAERHLGLDDTDLMLRTVREEFKLKNMFQA